MATGWSLGRFAAPDGSAYWHRILLEGVIAVVAEVGSCSLALWMPCGFSRSLGLWRSHFPLFVLRHGTPGTVSHTGVWVIVARVASPNFQDPLSWDAWGGVLPLRCFK